MTRLQQVILIPLLLATTGTVVANEAMTVGGVRAERGSQVVSMISVPPGEDGVETAIPITVVNGRGDGPVLTLIAGIHGAEYAPILALQRVPRLLDADRISGAVIIVHVANLPAFQGRTIYFGPDDLENLNRSFPGDPGGSVTERIASTLTDQVIRQSDYLIDIHAGDANESLRPSYSAYYAEAGSSEVIEASQRIALAFGLDVIVRFRGPIDSPETAIYTSAQAVALGIPAMDVESGELGRTGEQYVRPIVEGVMSVMRELEMIPGAPAIPGNPLYINERARIYSEHDGLWYPSDLVQAGDYVAEGTRLGRITDYHGNTLSEIDAPASGILLILFGTPPVNRGDNIVVIGKVN